MLWSILHVIEAVVAPHAGKIIKNVFERGKSFATNECILHFVFKLSQSSEIVFQSYTIW